MTRREACNAALMLLTITKRLVCDYTFMYLKEWGPAFALPREPNWNSLESVHWLPSMSTPGVGNLFINVFTGGLFTLCSAVQMLTALRSDWSLPLQIRKGLVRFIRVNVEIWHGQVQRLKQFFFFIFLSFFIVVPQNSRRKKKKAPCRCTCPVFFCFFSLSSTEIIGDCERLPVDGGKIGHSSVTSWPLPVQSHYKWDLWSVINATAMK